MNSTPSFWPATLHDDDDDDEHCSRNANPKLSISLEYPIIGANSISGRLGGFGIGPENIGALGAFLLRRSELCSCSNHCLPSAFFVCLFIVCAMSPVLHIWAFRCLCERFGFTVFVGRRAVFVGEDHFRCIWEYKNITLHCYKIYSSHQFQLSDHACTVLLDVGEFHVNALSWRRDGLACIG